MPYFTVREKEIIRLIDGFEIEHPEMLGNVLTPVIFKDGQIAVVISKRFNQCCLLALNDGGHTHHRARARVIELVSLLEYLEENRYIVIMNGPYTDSWDTFYKGYIPMGRLETIDHTSGIISSVTERQLLENNQQLQVKECFENGIMCGIVPGIYLGDGNTLTNIEYGDNLKEKLIKYLCSYVYPTLLLHQLVRDNFKSESEINNERVLEKADVQIEKAGQQVKRGTQAVMLALITLVLTILVDFLKEEVTILKLVIGLIAFGSIFVCGYMLRDGQEDGEDKMKS